MTSDEIAFGRLTRMPGCTTKFEVSMKKIRSRNTTSMSGAMSSCPFLISVLRFSRSNRMLVPFFTEDVQ